MKLFSTSSFLALASTAIFSVAGIAQAQYGGSTSGQGSSAGQSGSTGSSSTGSSGASGQGNSQSTKGGTAGDGMDTGYVDQQKRMERSQDAGSPSKDSHVPDFPVDKEGRPKKDPRYEQGGPIGPN